MFHMLPLAMALSIPALHKFWLIQHIKIYTTDPILPTQCLDHSASMIDSQVITNILNTYQCLKITICQIPPGKVFKTLLRARSAAAEAARRLTHDADNLPTPTTKDQLHSATY
jgi:hypothetical protein